MTSRSEIWKATPCLRPIGHAEGLPLAGVLQAGVEAGLDAADRQRGDRDAAVVEGGQELRVAAAPLAEQVAPRGRGTSSKLSGWVSEACQPSLSYAGSAVKPGVPLGTMIAEISGSSAGPSRARRSWP